jgi:GT2 family glycosyltransferase
LRQTAIRPGVLGSPFPRVGVVILTWNKKDYILALLDSLAKQPYPNWDVLVVDNCSSDHTKEAVLEKHPWVDLVTTPVNLGGSGGFNAGLCTMLKRGGYDYVWLLDNDVVVEPGALEVLVETLESRPDAAVAGSHMIQLDRPDTTNEIGADVDLARGRLLLGHHTWLSWLHQDEVFEVDYVAAASLLVRFPVLEEVGIWDDFFIHYDDVDWCLRIRGAGYAVLACAASRIRHLSANAKRVTWILYYDIRNILYLQDKHASYGFRHYLFFSLLLLLHAMRDELGG